MPKFQSLDELVEFFETHDLGDYLEGLPEVSFEVEIQEQIYLYDNEDDVLEVYFRDRRPAWTIELTSNIMISIDRSTSQAVGLTFLDYRELIRSTPWGVRSFPVTGLADLPVPERELVLRVLNQEPVSAWLDVAIVEGYRFRFYSSDINEPPHMHVIRGDNEAKIWLQPVEVEYNYGYNSAELNRIVRLTEQNEQLLLEAWDAHFNQ